MRKRPRRTSLLLEGLESRLAPACTYSTFPFIQVATVNDSVGSGPCSLREAISLANTSSGDVIILPPGQYDLTQLGPTENVNSNRDLDINRDVTISGQGSCTGARPVLNAGTLTLAGQPDRVFDIGPAATGPIYVTILNVDVMNGNVLASNETGGGIRNYSNLTYLGCRIHSNQAVHGGGIANEVPTPAGPPTLFVGSTIVERNIAAVNGGGIYAWEIGYVFLYQSLVQGNSARQNGGGMYSMKPDVFLWESTLANNTASTGNGGGLWVMSNSMFWSGAYVFNSTFSANRAAQSGGGIYHVGSTLYMIHVTLTLNHADSNGTSAGTGGGLWASTLWQPDLFYVLAAHNYRGPTTTSPKDDVVGQLSPGSIHNYLDVNGGAVGLGGSCLTPNTCINVLGPGLAAPNLGPLANNGGPTTTHALLAGSPAANHLISPLPMLFTDQRGTVRDTLPDIGAFERVGCTPSCEGGGPGQYQPTPPAVIDLVFLALRPSTFSDPVQLDAAHRFEQTLRATPPVLDGLATAASMDDSLPTLTARVRPGHAAGLADDLFAVL